MIYILQISNLHFLKNNNSNIIIDSFFQEVTKKLKDVPRGKKLLIINGDFHNYSDTNYQAAELFLKRLVCIMDLDITQDVFLIPGNRDIGNDALLKSFLEKKDPNWKSHQETCLALLEKGNTDCIGERLKAFLPYSSFLQHLRVYDVSLGEDYPARTHIRNWRGKMNILHLNTCLIANGESRTNHITDVHSAADSKTWETYFDKGKPTIAIGHNDFYHLMEKQQLELKMIFILRNISAYLCGEDNEKENTSKKIIFDIPQKLLNVFKTKKTKIGNDKNFELFFCWHQWNEENDKVTVEYRKMTGDSLEETIQSRKNMDYYLRRGNSKESSEYEILNINPSILFNKQDFNKKVFLYLRILAILTVIIGIANNCGNQKITDIFNIGKTMDVAKSLNMTAYDAINYFKFEKYREGEEKICFAREGSTSYLECDLDYCDNRIPACWNMFIKDEYFSLYGITVKETTIDEVDKLMTKKGWYIEDSDVNNYNDPSKNIVEYMKGEELSKFINFEIDEGIVTEIQIYYLEWW